MNITCVTTFHKPGLELYGQKFVDSFCQNVDEKIRLYVYAEDCNPKIVNNNQVTVFDAGSELGKLNTFKVIWGNDPKANGKCPWPERRPRDHHKEFKWDAVRFANKVYAVFDAAEKTKTDWLVWVDADTFVHSHFSYDDFLKLLPSDKWLTYVGRGKGSQTWPECGFYGMNLNHKTCQDFLKEFENYYEDADNGIFTLEEWHDSYVFGTILNKFKAIDSNVVDYTANIANRNAKTGGGGHPLINSELGKWLDHMKGNRKNLGKSQMKDLVNRRTEEYWNEV